MKIQLPIDDGMIEIVCNDDVTHISINEHCELCLEARNVDDLLQAILMVQRLIRDYHRRQESRLP